MSSPDVRPYGDDGDECVIPTPDTIAAADQSLAQAIWSNRTVGRQW